MWRLIPGVTIQHRKGRRRSQRKTTFWNSTKGLQSYREQHDANPAIRRRSANQFDAFVQKKEGRLGPESNEAALAELQRQAGRAVWVSGLEATLILALHNNLSEKRHSGVRKLKKDQRRQLGGESRAGRWSGHVHESENDMPKTGRGSFEQYLRDRIRGSR